MMWEDDGSDNTNNNIFVVIEIHESSFGKALVKVANIAMGNFMT